MSISWLKSQLKSRKGGHIISRKCLFECINSLQCYTPTSSGGSRISSRRGRQLPGGGVPTYNFAKFSQKLHEIERIWTPEGAHPSRPPPRSATDQDVQPSLLMHWLYHWLMLSVQCKCTLAVADLRGAQVTRAPLGSKFFQFHAVFEKIWENLMLAPLPPPRKLAPPPRGNPGSATVWYRNSDEFLTMFTFVITLKTCEGQLQGDHFYD